ncbi:MAG: glycosyltransferase family 2 protein, partial [Propionicimonas sp.]
MSSYEHERYLRRSIDSVLNQAFSDFELFILDDASTDSSWEIIQTYTDPRIHPLRNPVNRNDKVVMRQVIAESASGEYFAVHHSDNTWQPGKLQAQVDFLETHPQTGAVFTNALAIDENDREITDEKNWFTYIFDQPNRSREEWLNFFFYHGNALCHP